MEFNQRITSLRYSYNTIIRDEPKQLKPYYKGKIRGSRNKMRIRNLMIHRHNQRVLHLRKIEQVVADRIAATAKHIMKTNLFEAMGIMY